MNKFDVVRCRDSKQFQKNKKKAINKVNRELKKWEEDSPMHVMANKKMELTVERFDNFANSGQFCDETGYPVLIADPGLQFKTGRAQDVFIPSILFFYLTGWLLHQGKKHLQWIQATSKTAQEAREREIATGWDYPMALYFLATGWAWPVDAWNELRNGTITNKEKYIYEPPL